MYSIPVRLALVVSSIGFGIYLIRAGDSLGWMLMVVAALLVYGHFRYGTVWLAFRAVKRSDMDRAARLLTQVSNPKTLSSQQRAYFEMVSGMVAAHREQGAEAEQHLQASLDYRLRTENDRAIVEATLAELLAKRGDISGARALLDSAR